MINYEELNRKLAEWAGWESIKPISFGRNWKSPRDEWFYRCPNFTQSLDACFEWLVPKIYLCGIGMMGHNEPSLVSYYVSIKMAEGKVFFSEAKTLALTLCLAIEKLVDDQGNR